MAQAWILALPPDFQASKAVCGRCPEGRHPTRGIQVLCDSGCCCLFFPL